MACPFTTRIRASRTGKSAVTTPAWAQRCSKRANTTLARASRTGKSAFTTPAWAQRCGNRANTTPSRPQRTSKSAVTTSARARESGICCLFTLGMGFYAQKTKSFIDHFIDVGSYINLIYCNEEHTAKNAYSHNCIYIDIG